MADYTTELLVEVYQGEEEFVAANTKIGEVRISGLDPMPRGQQVLEVKFILDVNGTLSTICRDMRTNKTYEGSFKFDTTRMPAEEIRKKRAMIQAMMSAKGTPAAAAPAAQAPPTAAAAGPAADDNIFTLPLEKIPADSRIFWQQANDILGNLDPGKQAQLRDIMSRFASAVAGGDAAKIEEMGFLLQDVLVEVSF
jgi:molecular chaperone DnaK (HSP70)